MLARGMRNLTGKPSRPPPEQDEAPAPRQEDAPLATLDESRLSPEDQRFVDEVRSRATLAARQTAYARLGVSPQATAEAIKAAYLQAAKRYHPDRAGSQPALAGLQPELQAVFGALKDAYDVLSTPDQRAHYDESLKAGNPGKPTSRQEEAAMAVKMGEVLLKKRDFDGAIQKLRRAADLEPTGDTLAALAWALMSDPKHATKEEAASLINRALRAPGTTARTFYVAGVVWRTKDPESAVDAFRKTLELDPGHSDASLELRLLESRRKGGKPAGGGVLSGLLFGKRKNS
jgi:curved DNA-binding protein CbpA